MTPAALLILGIIDKALSIWLLELESMPPELRAARWELHAKFLDWMRDLFDRETKP